MLEMSPRTIGLELVFLRWEVDYIPPEVLNFSISVIHII